MSEDRTLHRSKRLRAAALAGEGAIVAAGVLLVLRYQYGAAWLQPYELRLDALLLGGVLLLAVVWLVDLAGAERARGVLLRLTLALAMTVLSLVVGEYALRFHYRDVRSSSDHRDYFSNRGPVLRHNSLGFREREIPPKAAARFRIAVVGDSFTYGNGLEEEDRLSNILQTNLGERYEVFNFGVPGNNMDDHLGVLERALTVSPDFVLLQLFPNDFEASARLRPRPYPLLPGTGDSYLLRRSVVFMLAKRGWNRLQEVAGMTESYADYMERLLADPHSRQWAAAGSQLYAFFRRAAAAGVGAAAVMFPAADAVGGGREYPYSYLHQRVQQVCIDEGVRCVDLLPVLAGEANPRAWWVSPFDAHPSRAANKRAAAAVLNGVGPLWSQR